MPFVQIKGTILSFEEFTTSPRKKRIVAHFSDGHGVVDLVWWNGAKYVYKNYHLGEEYLVFGKPGIFGGRYQFAHPDIEKLENVVLSEMGMQPYYITTELMKKSGLLSRQIEKITQMLVDKLNAQPLPET